MHVLGALSGYIFCTAESFSLLGLISNQQGINFQALIADQSS
jgi:hypothetical protein